MRDNDKAVHHGKGVLKAIDNVKSKIAPALIAKNYSVQQQEEIDNFFVTLDGSENKGFLFGLHNYQHLFRKPGRKRNLGR